jgi:hypothetical protein
VIESESVSAKYSSFILSPNRTALGRITKAA